MSYASKRSGKSALFLGLLIAALVALIYHAARGSRAAQVSLLVIGVLGVGAALMAQNSDTKSGAAPNLTLAPRTDRQEPGQPQLLPPASRDISPSNPLPYVEAAKGPVQQDAPVGDSWPTFAGDQRTPSTSSGTDLGSSVAVEQPLGVQFPTAVVTRTANIRSDPSMAGAVMGQVSAGTTLTVRNQRSLGAGQQGRSPIGVDQPLAHGCAAFLPVAHRAPAARLAVGAPAPA